ncbi:MAG: DUF1080 domain-containing protein, partial [Ginsengibacter sp.]
MKKISISIKKILHYVFALFVLLVFTISTTKVYCSPAKTTAASPIEGRWDITVDIDGKKSPSWLEVRHSGLHTLVGHFVGIGGSARPISKVNFVDGKISFSIPPQWEPEDNDLVVEGTLEGDNLTGKMTFSNGKVHAWTGVRAPALRRESAPVWGKPIILFDGKNIAEWHTEGANQWVAEGGL